VQTFNKTERISLQREIDLLFNTGTAFTVYPLRVIYVIEKPLSGAPCAILISVAKKRFKRAVKRNRLKRLIRETYRLNKPLPTPSVPPKPLLIAFIYIGNAVCDYATMEASMKKALGKLASI
jgi:ribonuclease P protein component